MRIVLSALLAVILPLASVHAYEGEEYPEQYDYQGEVPQEETYPDDSYQEPEYQEETAPAETYQEEAAPAEPEYQDPDMLAHQQEARKMCQEYANDVPPEDQASYVEDCMHSQGY